MISIIISKSMIIFFIFLAILQDHLTTFVHDEGLTLKMYLGCIRINPLIISKL